MTRPQPLLQLKRTCIKLIIHALLRDQRLMVAALDDVTVVENHDRLLFGPWKDGAA